MGVEKVILIGFNRSKLLIENYIHIRNFFDGKIDLYVDGPRTKSATDNYEQKKIKEYFLSKEDSNLSCNFSKKNRGCQKGVIFAISSGFKDAQNAIIIEDDCFVSETFFKIFKHFLKYKNENLVVSSKCLFNSEETLAYYYNHSIEVWGWGCTRDIWRKFEKSNEKELLRFWLENYNGNFINKWNNIHDLLVSKNIDTWDFPFKSFLFKQGVSIISFNKNMVENKGFDSGTHETLQNKVPWFNYPFDSKTFELNQKYIKHFEKIHIFNTRKLIKSILSFSLYKLGYVRLRKGIKRTKYIIDALNH